MFIKVTSGRPVELHDRDNFRAFKLVVDGPRDARDGVRAALEGVGELVGPDTAWIFWEVLRRRPDVVADAAWQQSFDAMIEKARPHGWIDDARKAIKAHVEWVG